MSRPPEPGRLAAGFLLTALLAWALARPLLAVLSLGAEEGVALAYALASSLLITLVLLVPPRLKFLPPLAVSAAVLLPALLAGGSLPARVWAYARALASGAAPGDAAILYLDALLPLALLLLALYARAVMEGEPAFSIPLLCAPLLACWFLGAREELALYFPAALCFPLLYLYTARDAQPRPLDAPVRSAWPRAAAVALALALLALALSPGMKVTQPQAEKLARDIRQAVEDRFFFTTSRSTFSLASQGYQPMGEKGLGGRPEISDAPLMTVQAQERIYLRGTALDAYDGRRWYDTLSSQRYAWGSIRWAALRGDLFGEGLPAFDRVEEEQASVTLLQEMPSTLFLPQRLRALGMGEGMVPYFNASSEVFITRGLEPGDSYSVRYEAYIAGEPGTDALAARLARQEFQVPALAEEYVRLPAHLARDGLVRGLALEIAGGISGPYAQAKALMRRLRTAYAYSLDVPDAPEHLDFVSHFLFDIRAGYCTYFASAMTVLARSLGLPARYVEGFVARPGAEDRVTLSGMDAHAWTEVYIAGMGWVTFDATPSDGEGDGDAGVPPPPGGPPAPTPSPSPRPSTEPSPTPNPEQSPEAGENTDPPPSPSPEGLPSPSPESPRPESADPSAPLRRRFPWWLPVLLALAALLAWRVRAEDPRRRERRLESPAEVLRLYWQETLMARAALGEGLQPGETPLSYAARLGAPDAGLGRLAAAQAALVYGREEPGPDRLSLARVTWGTAWHSLPWHRRARLSLYRAFRPAARAWRGVARRLSGKRGRADPQWSQSRSGEGQSYQGKPGGEKITSPGRSQ